MPLIAEPGASPSALTQPVVLPSTPGLQVPGLAWPFRMSGRHLAAVEQGSIEDVEQSVHSYLATARGERPLSPDFGLEDPTFGMGVNTALVASEIMDAEDGRAIVTITATAPDGAGSVAVDVHVELAE